MKSPILFIVFNRIETTQLVFDKIRNYKPERLYVAADGARSGKVGELEKCAAVRVLVKNVDWPCEVKYLFRDQNYGCRVGVPDAISWFFSNENEGIILEDDIVPNDSFFKLMEELLPMYRNEHKVASISGCSLISSKYEKSESYFFSHYPNIWGWGTWKRAWDLYENGLKEWPKWNKLNLDKFTDSTKFFKSYWREEMGFVYSGADSWDHQFIFTGWKNNLLHIIPSENLIDNIGFGSLATHTTNGAPKALLESEQKPLEFPLIHPQSLERNTNLDRIINQYVYMISLFTVIKLKLKRIPVIGKVLYKVKEVLHV